MEQEERDHVSGTGKAKGTLVTNKMISHWNKALAVSLFSRLQNINDLSLEQGAGSKFVLTSAEY